MTDDLAPGLQINRLTLVGMEKRPGLNNGIYWRCKCSCGNEKLIRSSYLRNRTAVGCGCAVDNNGLRHGLHRSPEYRAWNAMKDRCLNPKNKRYRHYGGRGIKVCDSWLKFENFYADMGPRPSPSLSIDRVNNDGNYEPGNCQWSTLEQQNNNRSFYNRYVTVDGVRMTVAQASRILGLSHSVILNCLNRGKIMWMTNEDFQREYELT